MLVFMRTIRFACLVLVASACNSTTEEATSTETPKPASDADAIVFATTPVTLAPAEEKYVCWDLDIPAGAAFPAGAIDMELAPGIHHYQLTANGAATTKKTSPYECARGMGAMGERPPSGTRPPDGGQPDDGDGGLGRTLSVGGPDTPGVHFPEGTAIMLEPGSRLVMQLHILNAGSAPREYGVVKANVRRAKGDPATLAAVGVMLVNDDTLDIPAGARGIEGNRECSPTDSLDNVFLVWPHMHLLGTSVRVAFGDREIVNVPSWDFDDQKLYPMKESLSPTTKLKLHCTYDNPTDRNVKFGMGTNDEMCSAFVYYWPAKSGADLCGGRD
jgi:hypothetical protein